MPSKKPAAKLKKVKKTLLKKAEPAKKSAAGHKPAAPAMSAKSAARKKAASVKTISRPAAKLSQTPKHQQTAKEPAVKHPAAKAELASKKTASKGSVSPRAASPEAKPSLSPPPAQTSAPAARTPPVRAIATSSSMSHSNSQYSAADADDSDGADGNINLLAGPRNVKPYIPRRGEQYMSKEQLDHFQQILLSWKNDLMEEVDRTVLHMKDEAANFPDPNDRATQESEFSLELRTRDRERKLIRKIDEALKRIEDGTYGYCIETGEEIGIKRLEARPVATLSVEAQERRERREKQYGDRDDRYR
jgi:DnaK suppressor protein